jgi:hypothetical protein
MKEGMVNNEELVEAILSWLRIFPFTVIFWAKLVVITAYYHNVSGKIRKQINMMGLIVIKR